MKKTLMTCLAIVALFAIASSASAITCTVDQRPAATLLVPYFEAAFNADGTITTGAAARDTIVTIVNASSAPMIAHVNVFNERSFMVLDFNICLTGFDVQAMSIANILRGNLPTTPVNLAHVPATLANEPCQRRDPAFGGPGPAVPVYPSPAGFLRVLPTSPANASDNRLATCAYPLPAWPPGSTFAFQTLDSLDDTPDSLGCAATDGRISGPIRGYIVIDHANYCTLSNPADAPGAPYYRHDAIGMENNLFGEVIFTSGTGLPTMGGSTVNIEADASFAQTSDTARARTFYARYWRPTQDAGPPAACTNCVGATVAARTNLFLNSPWNVGLGDQREPLGLKYAARWFDAPAVTSNFNVWRGSAPAGLITALGNRVPLFDLTGTPAGRCTDVEPTVTLTFFDEDENTVTGGVCPSPCEDPTFNFPLETQRFNITRFTHPNWPAGWVSMGFFNGTGPQGGNFDQAWVEYDFQGPAAFLSISAPGTQLDPSTCNPLGVGAAVTVIAPTIPAIVGVGP